MMAYIVRTTRYYRGTQQCVRSAPFLMLMTYDELGKRMPLRGLVRQVALHQCGHFMMGRARVGGKMLSISGSYGSDGLPMTVDKETWERGEPLPQELEEKFWKGGGHNSAGDELPYMVEWARKVWAGDVRRFEDRRKVGWW